jgi:radical SAM superfamily enzyme
MEKDYALHPDKYSFFEIDDYIDFVIDFLEHLRPNIVVERFAGEVPPRFQVTSAWGLIRNEKIPVLVENRMKQRDTWQGKMYEEKGM